MYRRYVQPDELFSQALVLFMGTLFFGFLISWKLVGVDVFDAEMIVYIVLGGIFLLLFLLWMIIIALQPKWKLLDIAIDMEQKTIKILYSFKTYSFSDIRLIAYNKRHKQLRLLLRHTLVGFSVDELINDDGVSLNEKDIQLLSEAATVTEPKYLYNYPLMVSAVFMALVPVYALLYAKDYRAIIGSTYIPMYYVMAGVLVLIIGTYWIGVWLWTRHYHKLRQSEEH